MPSACQSRRRSSSPKLRASTFRKMPSCSRRTDEWQALDFGHGLAVRWAACSATSQAGARSSVSRGKGPADNAGWRSSPPVLATARAVAGARKMQFVKHDSSCGEPAARSRATGVMEAWCAQGMGALGAVMWHMSLDRTGPAGHASRHARVVWLKSISHKGHSCGARSIGRECRAGGSARRSRKPAPLVRPLFFHRSQYGSS
jgi:hypothetical protein